MTRLQKNAFTSAVALALSIASVGVSVVPVSAATAPDPISTLQNVGARASSPQMDVLGAAVPSKLTSSKNFRTAIVDNGVGISVPNVSSGRVAIGIGIGIDKSVDISLPFASNRNIGVVDPSGAISFDNGNGSSSVVVPKKEGSVQIATIISGPNSPQRYAYKFSLSGEARLIADPQSGAVIIANQAGVPVGQVQTPWAVDAAGRTVATHYEISGGTLTQVVDLSAQPVTFPVVADPQTLYFWWGQATKFSRSETKQVASAADAGYAALLTAFCGLIASAPGAVVCGVVSGALILAIGNQFKAAAKAGKCIQINQPYVGIIIGGPLTWSINTVTC